MDDILEFNMNKTTQLFIRACKSKDPNRRVVSVYKRFYCRENNPIPALICILSGIVDEFIGIQRTYRLLSDISPDNAWRTCEADYNFNEACFNVLVDKIRFTKGSKFEGLSMPLIFKKQQKL